MEIYHPKEKIKINDYEFSIINLRDESDIKESYFLMYDYLVEYLKNVIVLNNNFRKWYKTQSPKYAELLEKINKLVNMYYNYDNKMLSKEEIIFIFNDIKNSKESIKNTYIKEFDEKIEKSLKDEKLKYVTNKELIKNKQKGMRDMFNSLFMFIRQNNDKENFNEYIDKIIEDIKIKIDIYTKEDVLTIDSFENNKNKIKDEIKNRERTLLKYIYSKNLLYFDNYLHHLRNIYLGIRYYLQSNYMNKRYQKYDIEIYNKFYCCIKDNKDRVVLGMIVNKFKDKEEYLQEHIFISNNIKTQIFGEKYMGKQLSMKLHSYASNLKPESNKIYCNPMPSMLKIFKELDNDGKIKLEYITEEEKKEIIKKQIICFKFPPIVSIMINKQLLELCELN